MNCHARDTSDGKEHKHGESWCSTDKYEDSVGSRYFRHLCIEGEEIIEPCADFRQEICIEGKIEVGGQEFSQAACRVNRWQECVSQKEKEDCENKDKRDCKWIGEGNRVGNNTVGCVPEHPPGLTFWQEGEAEGICSVANTQCIVTFEKEGFLIRNEEKCIKNCECLEDSWVQKQREKCEALGDCGGKVNFVGVGGGKEGYRVGGGEIEETAKAVSYTHLTLPTN